MKEYFFKTFWFPEDQKYVATCDQYPLISHLADTEEEALAGLKKLIKEIEDDQIGSD